MNAGGGYTLPQQVYIPHPVLQQISTGSIGTPSMVMGVPAMSGAQLPIAVVPLHQAFMRPYPTASLPGVHGIRMVNVKASPGSA